MTRAALQEPGSRR